MTSDSRHLWGIWATALLSVCLSVPLLNVINNNLYGLWQNGRKFCPNFYTIYERSYSLVLCETEWLVEQPPLPVIFVQTDLVGAKTPIFSRYSLVAPQPWHPAKRSIRPNTNRKSTTRFSMSLRWTSYVVSEPLKGGGGWKQKTAKRPFSVSNRI